MAKAIYHQTGGVAVELDILKSYKDNTVDLGRDDAVVVGKCPVSEEAKPGHAVLVKKETKVQSGQGEKKPTKAELKASAKDAADALELASKNLEADPENEELKARVKEIEDSIAAIEEALK